MERLKRYFIAGLIVIAPIFLTVYVFTLIFAFADVILGRFFNAYLKKALGFYIPGIGFIIAIILILFTGFLTKRFIGRKVLLVFEKWFSSLPLIKKIYPTLKQIILFILAQKEDFGFKKVVLVEYPSKGIWSIAFLTNEQFQQVSKATGREMVSVFVPSTPGPISGLLIFVPKQELKFPDMSISDALKIVISGGVYSPDVDRQYVI
jgi:uncharacterized membrane protein